MAALRALAAVLVLTGVASGQVGTPPACGGAVTDQERFAAKSHRIKFHLRFHTTAGIFDARSVIKLPPKGTPDPACTEGEVVDFVVDELIKERKQFLAP